MLKPSEAKAFYDRFGAKQNKQSFYEDPALNDLIAHAQFGEAEKVFEFGSGTGRFADQLLTQNLPAAAEYQGSDLSTTMINLAKQRLSKYGQRAKVFQTDGTGKFHLLNHSVDRVISTCPGSLIGTRHC
jgi:ubiquinone/menaquinone biosynthesis C-methylase UbiE